MSNRDANILITFRVNNRDTHNEHSDSFEMWITNHRDEVYLKSILEEEINAYVRRELNLSNYTIIESTFQLL